jgi:asparagine synthase (glutamine-hydrolysing)
VCGIAGIVRWDGQPVREDEIRAMCGVIAHRGPDDEGVYLGDGVAIGMRRLSIIDLNNGYQPISNEDGTVWIVFNGEIYNYQELRRDLLKRGHTFRTESDTETIVHLYEDLGPRCVDRLRGMFAFAIWDTRRRQVLLARDRLGIKPLYYCERDGELLFASELKPILQIASVERSLDWESVGHLFTTLATPATRSIVKGVQKLEPARFAVGSQGRNLRIERYWDLDFSPNERATEAEFVEELRERLAEAVTLHQISDVPVGAFLSGGLDSSAVVAMMSRPKDVDLKTFSIGFAEATHDELPHAREVAAKFGTDHYDLVLRPNVVQIVEDLTWYLDEPFGDTSAIPTYMVSKLAAEHVKVVLSGDGGDELFAGYDKYVVEGRERVREQIPRALRKTAGAVGAMMPFGMTGPPRTRGTGPLFRRLDDVPHRRDAAAVPERSAGADRAARRVGHRARRMARARWRLARRGAVRRHQPLPSARHPDEGRSDDDGALDRGAAAAARSQVRGVRGDHPGALPTPGGRHEAHLQEGDARHPARLDHRPAEARVRGAARPLVPERPRHLRAGRPAVADVPRAGHLRHPRRGASVPAARARPRSRSAALDDAVVRVVVPAVPGYEGRARRRARENAADAPEATAASHHGAGRLNPNLNHKLGTQNGEG